MKRLRLPRQAKIVYDKVSWWYWFDKVEVNKAKCKHCDWVKDRGAARSTSILHNHLKTKHRALFEQRMAAAAADPERVRQRGGNAKGAKRMKRELMVEKEEEEEDEEVEEEEERENADVNGEMDDLEQERMADSITNSSCMDQSQESSLPSNEVGLDQKPQFVLGRQNNNANTDNAKSEMDMMMLCSEQQLNSGFQDSTKLISSLLNSFDNTNTTTTTSSSAIMMNGGATSSSNSNNKSHSYYSATRRSRNANDIIDELFGKSASTSNQNLSTSAASDRPCPIVKMSRVEHFSAAHRLHNNTLSGYMNRELFGKCNNPNGHGHNYTWRVVLEGPVDPMSGMVYNMADLKCHMAEVMELVDHKHLDKDLPYFRDNGIVSTTENLAVFLYNALAAKLTVPALLKKVVVGETDKNSFSYAGGTGGKL